MLPQLQHTAKFVSIFSVYFNPEATGRIHGDDVLSI